MTHTDMTQMNMTIVALVAVVAIVGLVALVMDAAPTQGTALFDDKGNMIGHSLVVEFSVEDINTVGQAANNRMREGNNEDTDTDNYDLNYLPYWYR